MVMRYFYNRIRFTQGDNDKIENAKENSDMTILVYNKNGKNLEI